MSRIKRLDIPRPVDQLPERLVDEEKEPKLTLLQQQAPPGTWPGPAHRRLEWKPMPYMDEYLDVLLYSRDRKPDYVRMVKVGLSHFANFLRDVEDVHHPEEIERRHILRFMAWLQTEARTDEDKPFSKSYRDRLAVYVRGWIAWLRNDDQEYIDGNPFKGVTVSAHKKVPKPLADDEIAMLFEAHRRQFNTMPAFAWHRQGVILTLLYSWGLRIHELAALNLSDVDPRLTTVKVRNKGHTRDKPLPYSGAAKQSVISYLGPRAREAKEGEVALLIEATRGGRLSLRRIREIITTLGERAGVTINPHRLRDSFGTKMANSGAELKHVQVLMGHSQLSMTLDYVDILDDPIVASHERIMGPLLDKLTSGPLPLPDGIDEPPDGWPTFNRPAPADEGGSR